MDLPMLSPHDEEKLRELVSVMEAMDASRPGSSSASSLGLNKKKRRKKRRTLLGTVMFFFLRAPGIWQSPFSASASP